MMQALETHYYRQLPQLIKGFYKDDKLILDLFKSEIDAKNIANIFRAKQAGLTEEETRQMVFESGNLSPASLEELIKAKDVEAGVNALRKEYDLLPALEAFKKDGSLIHFEVALEKGIAGQGLKALSRSILSLGSIIGFLFLKEEEVSNIRKIVRAKEYDLPQNKIKEMMVLVA
jgi:V/A-type H+-transporting ATPase subunit C